MNSDGIVLACIDALESIHIPYMVVGSLSSNLYSIPRSTQDADFIVELAETSLTELMGKLGSGFRLDPQLSFESVTATTRHIIDIVDGTFRVELFQLSDDPHDRERFARRKRIPVLGRDAYAPTAEDVIVMKLRWALHAHRRKDRDDVRDIIAVQGDDALDWDYIHHWCEEHATRKLLDEIRASIPKID